MLFQITDISFDLEESCPYCGGDCIEFPITSCDDFAANATKLSLKRETLPLRLWRLSGKQKTKMILNKRS